MSFLHSLRLIFRQNIYYYYYYYYYLLQLSFHSVSAVFKLVTNKNKHTQTKQNKTIVNTRTHIKKYPHNTKPIQTRTHTLQNPYKHAPTHYKTQTYTHQHIANPIQLFKHPHITKPKHTHTNILQNPHNC
jgi:hypothetical protein